MLLETQLLPCDHYTWLQNPNNIFGVCDWLIYDVIELNFFPVWDAERILVQKWFNMNNKKSILIILKKEIGKKFFFHE